MGLGLGDFVGRWRLARRIEDARAGADATFRGRAVFRSEGAVLVYRESGTLAVGEREMEAEQSHIWRADGGLIRVSFADGRPFHAFDATSGTPTARHDCAPDTYDVTYDFTGWPAWRAEWRVTGPRKDYLSVTRYEPEG